MNQGWIVLILLIATATACILLALPAFRLGRKYWLRHRISRTQPEATGNYELSALYYGLGVAAVIVGVAGLALVTHIMIFGH